VIIIHFAGKIGMKLHNVTKLMIFNYFICFIWLFGWYVVGISAFSLLTTKGTGKTWTSMSTSQTSMDTPLNGLIFDNYEPYYSPSQTTGIQKGQFVVVLSSSSLKQNYEEDIKYPNDNNYYSHFHSTTADTDTTIDDRDSTTSRQRAFSIQNIPLWKRAMATQRVMSSSSNSRTPKADDQQRLQDERQPNSSKLSMQLASLFRVGLPYMMSWSDSLFNFPMTLNSFKTSSKTYHRSPNSMYERYSSSIRLRYRTKLTSSYSNDF
jgi:hypothetical protein